MPHIIYRLKAVASSLRMLSLPMATAGLLSMLTSLVPAMKTIQDTSNSCMQQANAGLYSFRL